MVFHAIVAKIDNRGMETDLKPDLERRQILSMANSKSPLAPPSVTLLLHVTALRFRPIL